MYEKFGKVATLLLAASFLCASMTACNDTGGVNSNSVSDSTDTSSGVNPPEDVGSPTEAVDFDLQSPGDKNFDDVGLENSTPSVEPVGNPNDEDTITYDVPESNTPQPSTMNPDLNSEEGESNDKVNVPGASTPLVSEPSSQSSEDSVSIATPPPALNSDSTSDSTSHSDTVLETPPTPTAADHTSESQEPEPHISQSPISEPEHTAVPEAVKLPNTGMFIEDD